MKLGRFSDILSSRFVRDSFWQGAGNILAQVMMISTMPLLTRLFAPEDFGGLGLFLQFVTFVSIFLTFRYEYLLQVPDQESNAFIILQGVLRLLIVMVGIFTVLLLVFAPYLVKVIGPSLVGFWLPLVPLVAAFASLSVALQALVQRQQNYRASGLSELTNKGVYIISALVGYGIGAGLGALLIATLAGLSAKSVLLFKAMKKEKPLGAFSLATAIKAAKKLRAMAMSLIFSHIMLAVTSGLPIFFIARQYNDHTLGQFTLAFSTLYLPASLIGAAIGQVYTERANKLWQSGHNFAFLFRATSATLAVIALPTFLIIAWLAPIIYPLVFGPVWVEAGSYARILALSSGLAFATTPMDRSGIVVNAWLYIPTWHLLRAVTTIGLVVFCKYYEMAFPDFLWLLTVQMSVMYMIDFCAGLKFSHSHRQNGA
jgi:O-antigen/teichoic acid export membrane protein